MAIGRELALAGRDGGASPRPGRLPGKETLEYLQLLVTVALLLLALGLFGYYLVRAPRKALSMALGRVGMRP